MRLLPAGDAALAGVLRGASADAATSYVAYSSALGQDCVLALHSSPLRVDLYVRGSDGWPAAPSVVIGDRGFVYYEHRRSKVGAAAAGAAGGDAVGAAHGGERKVLSWGEDGKAIYEGGGGEDEAGAAVGAAADAAAVPAAADAGPTPLPGLWDENFGTHADSKPFGPMSIGFDATFLGASTVYGIPEHASTHALRATDGSEGGSEYAAPYRLYNLDVFEYELDNPMALYGSIPFLLAHDAAAPGGGATVGLFWHNPTETYVDIKKRVVAASHAASRPGVASRWISESGVWDLSLIPGPAPKAVIARYTSLTGTQALPPLWALGYHQCRWNYKDEADVYAVDAAFEAHAFPYDVLWLDIEHTDGKRYFTWDSALFPSPAAMQEKLASRGHKMVTIIDPHIKKDTGYRIHREAADKGLYVRSKSGGEYDGWCWPGSSGYLDFTSPAVRAWWADQFAFDKYIGSTPSLYTWNDMNEPSVFNGPEVSMHKDALSLAGVEHREWHNLYGFYQAMATAAGQVARGPAPERNGRHFVLSRSFFAGSQRHGAIWTGDNDAKWEHLAAAAPMLLTIGAAGLSFAGADVGGFFHNPTTELMTRWYEAGSWQPFFRAHAHIETARREPWLFGDDVLTALRDIVRTRYTYLPLWYTIFAEAHASGAPPMRALWLEYPADAAAAAIDDQWLVGDALLVKPVVTAGATSVAMYFPGGPHAPWYDVLSGARIAGGKGISVVDAPLNKIPVWQRGGSIVPRQMRPRRSSAQMTGDPYTLVVALATNKTASGTLYLDDGATTDFASRGLFRLRAFDYAPSAGGNVHVLRSSMSAGSKAFATDNAVERVIVMGIGRAPKSVVADAGDAAAAPRVVAFDYDARSDTLTLRKPGVKAAYDFTVTITF